MTRTEIIIIVVLVFQLVFMSVGAAGAYWWVKKHGPQPEVVNEKPTVVQTDNSVIAARHPSKKAGKPPHKLPPKAVEERRVAVTVQPTDANCPPVTTNLSLVRDGSGRRVVASSPDGQVTAALDIPIEQALMPPSPKPWAGGLSYDMTSGKYGLWVDRDVEFLSKQFVVGADVSQDRTNNAEARIHIGVRF